MEMIALCRRWALHAIGLALMASLVQPLPAGAQSPPGPVPLEALIKSTLLTFNDANVTGNYAVFHARLARPFRERFGQEQLKEAFKSFSEQEIDIALIAALKPTLTEEPRIDNRGALLVRGYFDTSPNRVTFSLDYLQSEGAWRLINISVKVRPPGE